MKSIKINLKKWKEFVAECSAKKLFQELKSGLLHLFASKFKPYIFHFVPKLFRQ
jgi:hypothetical protein